MSLKIILRSRRSCSQMSMKKNLAIEKILLSEGILRIECSKRINKPLTHFFVCAAESCSVLDAVLISHHANTNGMTSFR